MPTSGDRPHYVTSTAFRRALTDRLRAVAAPRGQWSLLDLQRQFAYDRLLARLYLQDDGWIVKGATALLARGIAVRHSIDIDASEADRRGLPLPHHFAVPDKRLWEVGYSAEAKRASGTVAPALSEALQRDGPFLDPLLQGLSDGRWCAPAGRWV